MKYLFTLLMACLPFSFTHGIKSHPSFLNSSGRWVVWSEKPAASWQDAFVTGNGSHGTMVMGQPGEERIICVHEELFIRGWDRNKVAVPCTASLLPQVRSLMESGKSDAADALMTSEADRQLVAMGARQRWPLIPHPAFDLCIRHTGIPLQTEKQYRRQLDLETGEVLTSWYENGKVTESVFSSREHNVNVVRLKADECNKMNLVLSLKETPGREGMHFEHNLDSAFSSVKAEAVSGWLSYRAGYKYDAGGYEGLARVTVKGGSMTAEGDSLRITDAEEVLVLIRITPREEARLSVRSSVQKELSGLPLDYGKLLKPIAGYMGKCSVACSWIWDVRPTGRPFRLRKCFRRFTNVGLLLCFWSRFTQWAVIS
jgi:alpha-L-fucosidase 2